MRFARAIWKLLVGVKDALVVHFIDDAKSNTATVACNFVLKMASQPL